MRIRILILTVLAGRATQATAQQSPPPLSLERSLELALRDNPAVKAQRFHWNAARAAQSQAQARQGFALDTRYGHTRQGPVIQFGGREVVRDFRNDLNFVVSKPLWSPELSAERRLAEVNAQRVGDDYETVRQDLVLETTRAFLAVLRAEALMDVARKSVAANEERRRVAEAMFNAGTSPRFDVLRAEVQLAAARERLVAATSAVAIARAELNTVLGRATDTPVSVTTLERKLEPVPAREASFQVALRSRPELAGAAKQIALNQQRERIARAGDLPSISVSASYNRQTATSFGKDYRYDAAIAVNLPVFDSGASRAGVREAREAQAAAREATEQTRQRITLEVERALLSMEDARARIEVTARAVAQAEEALRIANVRYQARVAPIVEVIDAESALTQAGGNEVNAWSDYQLATARWRRAVGHRFGDQKELS